ncbi:MAG: binary toxin-like calcium binding domain-containing protein [Promethearchaeota archaeon]
MRQNKKSYTRNKKSRTLLFASFTFLLLPAIISAGLNSFAMVPNDDLNGADNNKDGRTVEIWSGGSKLRSSYPNEIIWSYVSDYPFTDVANSIWSNGTYLYTCGGIEGFGSFYPDAFLAKWDLNGNLIWNKTVAHTTSIEDYLNSIWSDGTYLYTCGYYGGNLYLVKWDGDGNVIWNQIWNPGNFSEGISIWGDGTYIYTCGSGNVVHNATTSLDLLLVKWDTDGNQIWNRTWGGNYNDEGHAVCGDGTYIYTCGATASFSSGSSGDVLLVKWDTDGNQIWNRTWGGLREDEGNAIWTNGTCIYISGLTHSYGSGHNDVLIMRWDADGNLIWNRTWGKSTHDECALSLWSNGTRIYTIGYTWLPSSYICSLLLISWDEDGNLHWVRNSSAGFNYWTDGRSIWSDGQGNLYMCGIVADMDRVIAYTMLIKFNSSLVDLMESDVDGDGLCYGDEIYVYFTDPLNNDTDSDGLSDGDEILVYLTKAKNNDTDSDGLSDGDEILVYSTNAKSNDTDSDGFTDFEEIFTYSTNASNNDTDSDGLSDGQEILTYNTNATNNDTDSDGLTDGDEILVHSTNATSTDTDSDGLSDGQEILTYNTNATNNDTDSDGLTDGQEILTYFTNATNDDTDSDGLTDSDEILLYLTNATNPDIDADGLLDGEEILIYLTNVTNNDTDGEGLIDGDELLIYGTNATNNDTDGDGFSDYEEVLAGTDPNDPNDFPSQENNDTIPIVPFFMAPFIVVFTASVFVSIIVFSRKRVKNLLG